MKKLTLITLLAAIVFGFSQCRKPMLPDYPGQKKMVTFTTSDEGGRGDFQNSSDKLRYIWKKTDGDKLYVYASSDGTFDDGKYCGILILDEVVTGEGGSSIASFKGELTMPYKNGKVKFIHFGKSVTVDDETGVASVSFYEQNGKLTNDSGESVSSKVVASFLTDFRSDRKYTGNKMTVEFAVAQFSFTEFDETDLMEYGVAANGLSISEKGKIDPIPGTVIKLMGANGTGDYYAIFNNEPVKDAYIHNIWGGSKCASINQRFEGNIFYHLSGGGAIQMVGKHALAGYFTYNGSGDRLKFAPGNLQYQASTKKWRFAEHQYDVVGGLDITCTPHTECGNVYAGGVKCTNNSISEDYSGWIDLFGWATSGLKSSGGYQHKQPYETSDINADYYAYGDNSLNLNDNDGSADWGKNFTDAEWFTPSKDDFCYIIQTRSVEFYNGDTKYNDFRYFIGKVEDLYGLFIFPDLFRWTSEMGTFPTKNALTSNNYTLGNFAAMEKAGVIFLPAAGFRINSTGDYTKGYNYFNKIADYWTSSNSVGTYGAYLFQFSTNVGMTPVTNHQKNYGFSVRLAAKVPNIDDLGSIIDDLEGKPW